MSRECGEKRVEVGEERWSGSASEGVNFEGEENNEKEIAPLQDCVFISLGLGGEGGDELARKNLHIGPNSDSPKNQV